MVWKSVDTKEFLLIGWVWAIDSLDYGSANGPLLLPMSPNHEGSTGKEEAGAKIQRWNGNGLSPWGGDRLVGRDEPQNHFSPPSFSHHLLPLLYLFLSSGFTLLPLLRKPSFWPYPSLYSTLPLTCLLPEAVSTTAPTVVPSLKVHCTPWIYRH